MCHTTAIFFLALPAQQKEIDSLQEFAKSRGFDDQLEQWDVAYWRRKQRASLFK
jgi:Zn-dependent oligopeptidase